MTRINAGIPVECLSDQHLLAEHREIKRIPNTKFTSKPTKKFTLGKGHVLFFSDKAAYTFDRYECLHLECDRRGFSVDYYGYNWGAYGNDLGDINYIPSQEDINLVVDRIISRVFESKQIPRYFGEILPKEEYIERLSLLKK